VATDLLEVDRIELPPYESYVRQFEHSARLRLGNKLGADEAANFRGDSQRVIGLVDGWLTLGGSVPDSGLVLGHVQSGKTAQIVGLLAWASRTGIECGVVASGATTALWSQTSNRLVRQLGDTGLAACEVITNAPTKRNEARVSELANRIAELVAARRKNPAAPLPVLCIMKNGARFAGVAAALEASSEMLGEEVRTLFVDDEADHISQNGRARAREESAAYGELKKWRESTSRHFYVGFTATPQAVLLTERAGSIRPRHVVVIGAGSEYLGLEHAMNSSAQVRVEGFSASQRREELKSALRTFFVGGVIRRLFPEEFYSAGNVNVLGIEQRMTSVQMLVHPSGMKIDHAEYLALVERAISDLLDELSDVNLVGFADPWQEVYSGARDAVLVGHHESLLPFQFGESFREDVRRSLVDPESTRVVVVNSDKDVASALPVSDEEWAQAEQWVVIGGDVVGRGVTLPQLLVMFYLRNPRSKTFDTSVQQARFCGYRNTYGRLVSIWAPDEIFDAYEAMCEVNGALFTCARKWEAEKRDLISSPPVVGFVSSAEDVRLEPTRKNVLDPDVFDVRTREIMFQSKFGHEPALVLANARMVNDFVALNRLQSFGDSGWAGLVDVPFPDALRFLDRWQARPGDERLRFSRLLELLRLDIGLLGLSERPISILVRDSETVREISEGMFSRLHRQRSLVSANTTLSWDQWHEAFTRSKVSLVSDLPPMKAYVGHGQRTAQAEFANHDTAVLVEPLNVVLEGHGRVGVALALGVMAPNGFVVRTVGLPEE
jgi:hypothetical protein